MSCDPLLTTPVIKKLIQDNISQYTSYGMTCNPPVNIEEIDGYIFITVGDDISRFDSYVTNFVIIPPDHPLVGNNQIRLSGFGTNVKLERDNIFKWEKYYRYYSTNSLKNHTRPKIVEFFKNYNQQQ
jgi:hypothetical protein